MKTNTQSHKTIIMKHYVSCLECGFPIAKVGFEQKYNGRRGICPKCGIDWPES